MSPLAGKNIKDCRQVPGRRANPGQSGRDAEGYSIRRAAAASSLSSTLMKLAHMSILENQKKPP